MPFSNAPTNDTYSQHRLPLVWDLQIAQPAVSFTPTAGMANVLPFKSPPGDEQPFYGETRAPIRNTGIIASLGSSSQCRGMYVWEKTIGTVYYFLVAYDSTSTNSFIYSSTDGITFALVNTLSTAGVTSPCRFAEFIDDVNTKKLVMLDGVDGWVFTSNASGTRIVDADFPTPHVPFPVFMDGYLYVAKANTGDIYNSDLNNPASWTAGSFLSSELYPDDIQALVKVNNYILAVGTQGCEYMYDAANAIGTPLARYEGASLPFGTQFPNSIASSKDTIVMLAQTNDGATTFKMIEGMKHSDINSTGFMQTLVNSRAQGTWTQATCRGSFFRQNGELFYQFMTARPQLSGSTIYCALKHQIWGLLGFNGSASQGYPVAFTAPSTSLSTSNYMAGDYLGTIFLATNNSSSSTTQDLVAGQVATAVQESITIPPQTFGTMNRKFMHRVGIMYWAKESTGTAAPSLSVQDDETTNQTAVQFVGKISSNINDPGQCFPYILQLGQFRYRSMTVVSVASVPHRWIYLEIDINKGQQ